MTNDEKCRDKISCVLCEQRQNVCWQCKWRTEFGSCHSLPVVLCLWGCTSLGKGADFVWDGRTFGTFVESGRLMTWRVHLGGGVEWHIYGGWNVQAHARGGGLVGAAGSNCSAPDLKLASSSATKCSPTQGARFRVTPGPISESNSTCALFQKVPTAELSQTKRFFFCFRISTGFHCKHCHHLDQSHISLHGFLATRQQELRWQSLPVSTVWPSCREPWKTPE